VFVDIEVDLEPESGKVSLEEAGKAFGEDKTNAK
jgi:hypothetical protein